MHFPLDPQQYTVPLLSAGCADTPLGSSVCPRLADSSKHAAPERPVGVVGALGRQVAHTVQLTTQADTASRGERTVGFTDSYSSSRHSVVSRPSEHTSRYNAEGGTIGTSLGATAPLDGLRAAAPVTERSGAGGPETRYQRPTFRHITELVPEGVRRRIRRLPTFVPIPKAPLYGEKTIGQWGSFVYLVNQIFGAGILALPYVVKVSGWLPCFFSNLLVCAVAMFGTLMIMRAMTMIHGNQNFERRIEYIPTVEYFLGRRFRFWTEVCFYLSIQSLNVVSITVVSQSVDHLLLWICGKTFGIVIDPWSRLLTFRQFSSQQDVDSIYSGEASGLIFGITLGYIINALVCIPLSCQNMDENMKIQYATFTFLITSVLQIASAATYRIISSYISRPLAFLTDLGRTRAQQPLQDPAYFRFAPNTGTATPLPRFRPVFNTDNMLINNRELKGRVSSPSSSRFRVRVPRMLGQYQYGQLLSTFIASYSYVNVIPSWANEMTPGVKVNVAVWLSSGFACVVYYVFGFVLAYAYPMVHTDNILQELLADDLSTGFFTKCSIYVFNLFTVLPGILVCSITTRYNLVNSGVASARKSFLLGCVGPFLFAWLLANDTYFSAILQWSSLIFSLAVNFVIPSVVYINACGTQRLASRNPTRHFQTFHSYANRTRQGVQSMVGDISAKLREYLHSLPSNEIDPDLRELLDQSTPLLLSPRESLEAHSKSTSPTVSHQQPSPLSPASAGHNPSRQITPSRFADERPFFYDSSFSLSLKSPVAELLKQSNDSPPGSALKEAPIAHPRFYVDESCASPSVTAPGPRRRLREPSTASQAGYRLHSDASFSIATRGTPITKDQRKDDCQQLFPVHPHSEPSQPPHPSQRLFVSSCSDTALNVLPSAPQSPRPATISLDAHRTDHADSDTSVQPSLETVCSRDTAGKKLTSEEPQVLRTEPAQPGTAAQKPAADHDVPFSSAEPTVVRLGKNSPEQRFRDLDYYRVTDSPSILVKWNMKERPAARHKTSTTFEMQDRTFSDILSYSAHSRLLSQNSSDGMLDALLRRFRRPKQVHFANLSGSSSVSYGHSFPVEVSSPLTLPAVSVLTSLSPKSEAQTKNVWKSFLTKPGSMTMEFDDAQSVTSGRRDTLSRGRAFSVSAQSRLIKRGRSLGAYPVRYSSTQEPSLKRSITRGPALRNCISMDLDVTQPADIFRAVNAFQLTLGLPEPTPLTNKKGEKCPHLPHDDESHSETTLVVPPKEGAPSIMITPTLDPVSRLPISDVTSNPILRMASIDYAMTVNTPSSLGAKRGSLSESVQAFFPYIADKEEEEGYHVYEGIPCAWPDAVPLSSRPLGDSKIMLENINQPPSIPRKQIHRLPTTLYLETAAAGEASEEAPTSQPSAGDNGDTSVSKVALPGAFDTSSTHLDSLNQWNQASSDSRGRRVSYKSTTGVISSHDHKHNTHQSDATLFLPTRHYDRRIRSTSPKAAFLAPPPVALNELPIDPPVDLMAPPVPGAEDAYECDEEPSTGVLKPIRIHVFPRGPLRTYHLTTTRVLMALLVGFCVLSAGSQILIDILQGLGVFTPPKDDTLEQY